MAWREASLYMSRQTIHRVSSHLILGLSWFALFLVGSATILVLLGRFNPSPGGDEGTAAHLFQLAVGLLGPAGLVFVITADWRHPLLVARRLVMPAVALIVAFAALYYMEHLP